MRGSRLRSTRFVCLVACAGVVLVGCSGSDNKQPAPAGAASSSSPEESSSAAPLEDSSFDVTLLPATKPASPAAPSPAPSGSQSGAVSPSATATAVVTPGRVFVFIKSIDLAKRTMTYDQAQFLTGAAANKAAAEDKQEVPVPNDYYIRNVNKRLRTAPITADAKILGSIALTQQVELKPVPLDAVATFAKTGQGLNVGFWITINGTGQITKIEEQFIP